MAAKLRVFQYAEQVLAKGVTKLRLYQLAVQVLWKDQAYWGGDFTLAGAVTAALTAYPPSLAVFPYPMKLGCKEVLAWNTPILRARDGSEQRISARSVPRTSFQMQCYIKDEQEQARLDSLLFNNQKVLWGLPIWTEAVIHNGTIASGSSAISFDTRYADFRDSGIAIIWSDVDSYEVIYTDTISDSQATLSSNVVSTWTGRKWIMPMRLAYMKTHSSLSNVAKGHGIFQCEFHVTDNEKLTGFTPTHIYKTLPVLVDASYVSVTRDTQIDPDNIVTDYNLGEFDVFSDSDHNIYVQSHTFRNFTKETCWDFKRWLHYLNGRRGAFWVPSFKNDIVLKEAIGSNDTIIIAETIGWAANMLLNTLRTHIVFVFTDGTYAFREVTDLTTTTDSAGNPHTEITIDNQLSRAVSIGDCEICWLDKCRLTKDTVEIVWDEPQRNICETSFTRVVS